MVGNQIGQEDEGWDDGLPKKIDEGFGHRTTDCLGNTEPGGVVNGHSEVLEL